MRVKKVDMELRKIARKNEKLTTLDCKKSKVKVHLERKENVTKKN